MNAVATVTPPKMMRGTQGNMDYLVIARKGKIVLGIKINYIGPGDITDTLYVGIRVRSAFAGKIFEEEDAKIGVVTNLGDHKASPDTAWDIPWEKSKAEYASTQSGIHLPGFSKPEELIPTLLDNKKLARDIVDGLLQLIGGEAHLIIGKRVIRDWLHAQFETSFKKALEVISKQKEVVQEQKASIGTFGVQTSSLKKLHDKLSAAHAQEVPDIEEESDEGNDEAGGGEDDEEGKD